jgi:mannosyltransferase OCH1-like enzyme
MIPKILLQTSKEGIPPQYVRDMLATLTGSDWTYVHFTNIEMAKYLKDNAVEEFPLIVELFDKLQGAHKSDLFRYYFLYKNGGVYIDTDAMLRCPLNEVINDCDLFCTFASYGRKSTFNGFIGCIPNHQIIYDALVDAYNTDPKILEKNYHLLCDNLFDIVTNHPCSNTKKLYEGEESFEYSITYDSTHKPVLFHYHIQPKIIPKDLI